MFLLPLFLSLFLGEWVWEEGENREMAGKESFLQHADSDEHAEVK